MDIKLKFNYNEWVRNYYNYTQRVTDNKGRQLGLYRVYLLEKGTKASICATYLPTSENSKSSLQKTKQIGRAHV